MNLDLRTASSEVPEAIQRFAAGLSQSDPFVVGVADAMLAMVVSDPTLPDNPIIYVNAAFEQLTGYPQADVLGRNCRFLQGPGTDPAEIGRMRDAIAARQRVGLDLLNYRRDGTPFWNRLMVTPVFGPDGAVRFFFASQLDVTVERERVVQLEAEQRGLLNENERVRREIIDTQARLDIALQTGQLGVWSFHPETLQLTTSPACRAAFGADPDGPFSFDDWQALVHPEDLEILMGLVARTVEDGSPLEMDYRIVLPSGERRWIAVRGTLVTRRDGSPLTLTGFVTDITARKDLEEHRALLAGELSHRVKNTLATVSAVVNQSLRTATSLEAARDAISARVASLADAHDLLTRDEIEGAPVGDIVRTALRSFDDGSGALFSISGPELRLNPQIAFAMSMAIHELATNAAKYGALSAPGGRVEVQWELEDEPVGQRLFEFRWQERGGPPVSPPTRRGFGTRMIDRLMAKQMRGEATTVFDPEGVRFLLSARL